MIDIDDLLRTDAEQWNRARPDIDLDALLAGPARPARHRPGRRALAMALSAAAVVLLVLGLGLAGAFTTRSSGPGSTSTVPTAASSTSRPPTPFDSIEDLVWSDAHSSGTLVFGSAGTIRVFDGCDDELLALRHHGDVLVPGRKPVGPSSVCSGAAHEIGPDGRLIISPEERRLALFHRVVVGPMTWRREGPRTLRLTRAGVGTIRLTTDGTRAPAPGAGPWRLTSYNDLRGFSHAHAGHAGDLVVRRDGSFAITNGCADITGTAAVSPTTITWRDVKDPRCPGDPRLAAVAQRIVSAPARYEIRGDELIVSGRRGGLMVFTLTR